MANYVTELFDGGTNGAALSTSNTAFDGFSGTAASVFSDANPYEGTLSALFTSTGNQHRKGYLMVPSLRSVDALSIYGRHSAQPSTAAFIATPRQGGSLPSTPGTTIAAGLRINTAGTVSIRNGVVAVDTSTVVLPLNSYWRIDWFINGTTQQADVYIGANVNGTIPDESLTGAYTSGNFDNWDVGMCTGVPDWAIQMDVIRLDNAAMPGPYLPGGGGGTAVDAQAYGQIGDSLTDPADDGAGEARQKTLLVSRGWNTAKMRLDGKIGRSIVGAAATDSEQIIAAWEADAFNPGTFVIELGANNINASTGNWTTWINEVLTAITALPGLHKIYWVNLGLKNRNDARALSFNATLASIAAGRTDLFVLDWYNYVHNKITTTDADWFGDADGIHMTAPGYEKRWAFIANSMAKEGRAYRRQTAGWEEAAPMVRVGALWKSATAYVRKSDAWVRTISPLADPPVAPPTISPFVWGLHAFDSSVAEATAMNNMIAYVGADAVGALHGYSGSLFPTTVGGSNMASLALSQGRPCVLNVKGGNPFQTTYSATTDANACTALVTSWKNAQIAAGTKNKLYLTWWHEPQENVGQQVGWAANWRKGTLAVSRALWAADPTGEYAEYCVCLMEQWSGFPHLTLEHYDCAATNADIAVVSGWTAEEQDRVFLTLDIYPKINSNGSFESMPNVSQDYDTWVARGYSKMGLLETSYHCDNYSGTETLVRDLYRGRTSAGADIAGSFGSWCEEKILAGTLQMIMWYSTIQNISSASGGKNSLYLSTERRTGYRDMYFRLTGL